ncbi:hypothetical protein PV797_00930 [Clostridiaceae bacterium M8S5]|nr:hypothetical protein PV797_00930 [Clostridiaceae bacterium M8S5]
MYGLKVIICDSGIDTRFSDNIQTIDMGLGWKDEHGHGSQIAEINKSLLDYHCFTSIKLLNKNNECNLEMLLNVLDELNQIEFDIVCLALAIQDDDISGLLKNELNKKINNLLNSGKIIISALHNRKEKSYPASLKGVFGVRLIEPENEGICYDPTRDIQFEVPLEPIICQSLDNAYHSFSGNSMGAAVALAHVCKVLEKQDISYFKKSHKALKYVNNNILFGKVIDIGRSVCRNEMTIKEKIMVANNRIFNDNSNHILNRMKDYDSLNNYITTLDELGLQINTNYYLRFSDLQNIESLTKYFLGQGIDNE